MRVTACATILAAAFGLSPWQADEKATLPQGPAGWRAAVERWASLPAAEQETVAWREVVGHPGAVRPLEQLAREAQGELLAARLVAALGRIEGRAALDALVRLSLSDPRPAVRRGAAHALHDRADRRDALPAYLRHLRTPRTAEAAEALRYSGLAERSSGTPLPEPTVFKALVDALVLPKRAYVPVRSWAAQWGPTGGSIGGYWANYREDVTSVPVAVPVPNPPVLDLLREYTRTDFGYDQQRWRSWYQEQAPRETP